jgi:hypothetical protein
MHTKHFGTLASVLLVASSAVAQKAAPSIPVAVDCNAGQSLNRTLAKLDKHTPFLVTVNGTCTEFVQVTGFNQLTLKGLTGATLVQPPIGAGNLFNAVLLIGASQSVTVEGLNVQADITTVGGIGIGHGSTDIRLRNLSVLGGTEGILVYENSQVSIAHVTARDPGYTPLGIYDSSDVHLEHSLFAHSTGALWHVGIDLGNSHITMYDTTIKNMQHGINAYARSVVDIQAFDTYYPSGGRTDVTIDSPAGTNYNGVFLGGGASLNVNTSRLVINKAGQPWGGNTGGILVSEGATLNAGANLVINGSQGSGIFVTDNSHATLSGSSITGSNHGGITVVNVSSVEIDSANPLTNIGGNAVDLFCDAQSVIAGSSNLAGAPSAQCPNLLPFDTVPTP